MKTPNPTTPTAPQPTTQPHPHAPAWTPGPWAVRSARLDEGYGLMICGPDETILARLDTWMGKTAEAEMSANAALLSAAPELAEALAELLQEADSTGGNVRHVTRYSVDQARALLARLQGNGEGGGV